MYMLRCTALALLLLRTLDHVGDCLAGEVQQALDVEVVGSLFERKGRSSSSSISSSKM
jgi:hypothetical protein